MSAGICISGVSKAFGAVRAVDRVTLDIAAGEFLTLLGPSGSGKTTLLNILVGFVTPDTGDVLIDGRSVLGVPPYRRGLGMVFQNYALFPHMTVAENVAFPLRMRGEPLSHVHEAVKRVLDLVQLPGMEFRYPHQLSGGQQQRVAVARAIVFDPGVLLMDEPLGALDKNLREQLQLELRRLQRQLGVTIVYVTHDQQEALVLSDRIAVMNRGRLVQTGTGRELYEHPASVFVAQFLGESNVMEGRVVSRLGDRAEVVIDGLRVTASGGRPTAAQEVVRLLLRPERVRLAPGSASGHPAVVEDTTYLGETLRCVLQLTPGPRIVAKFPPGPGAAVVAGAAVRLTWDPTDLRVLPADPWEASDAR